MTPGPGGGGGGDGPESSEVAVYIWFCRRNYVARELARGLYRMWLVVTHHTANGLVARDSLPSRVQGRQKKHQQSLKFIVNFMKN